MIIMMICVASDLWRTQQERFDRDVWVVNLQVMIAEAAGDADGGQNTSLKIISLMSTWKHRRLDNKHQLILLHTEQNRFRWKE